MSYLTGNIKEFSESREKQVPALFKPKETQMGKLSIDFEELDKKMKNFDSKSMMEKIKNTPKSEDISISDKAMASKIERFRKQAEDKSLPQDVRNQLLDNANKLEEKMGEKAGLKFAKGGMVKKMGYAKGGYANCGASMPPAQKGKK